MKRAVKFWQDTFVLLNKYRSIFVPFFITVVLEGIVLYILYLAPQKPVSTVFAPPIRAFFGERFLHGNG